MSEMEPGNVAFPALEGKAWQSWSVQTYRAYIRRMEACRELVEFCGVT